MTGAPETGPDPPEGDESDREDSLRLLALTRRLRAIEAERDSWRAEALALRKRLGIKPPPDRWRRPAPGFRRVWLDDNPSEWM